MTNKLDDQPNEKWSDTVTNYDRETDEALTVWMTDA